MSVPLVDSAYQTASRVAGSSLRRMTCSLWLCGALAVVAQAQTRRALLIGIDHYAPPPGSAIPLPAEAHAADSRFAPGASWIDLHGPSVDVATIQVLLQQKYGFQNIRALDEQEATRQGILAAINQLVSDTQPGDLDVFYYSGHGSRRLDTLSSKNQFDETIVPIDAWKGAEDIRDKELALLFDKIIYEKHAHLTAIFDSCSSGTMARGITNAVQRALPYDDRDVALEKASDASTVTETDLNQQIPQDGDAIIVAASGPAESAVEAKYPDDGQFHGAFTRALVRVLRSSPPNLSGNDVIADVTSLLHADPVPPQQPSIEGRGEQSLFGNPIAAHRLRVHVTNTSPAGVTLDLGSAASFAGGTQFTSIEAGPNGRKTLLEIQTVDAPFAATARVVDGGTKVAVGQTFELSKMTYPQAASVIVFASLSMPSPAAAAAAAKQFPGLTFVDDPATRPINFMVAIGAHGFVAYDPDGNATADGSTAKGAAFLLLGPPLSLKDALEHTPAFEQGAFRFTDVLPEANYLLGGRTNAAGMLEYALFDPVVTAHSPEAWIASPEDDPNDTALTGSNPPIVVCRGDASSPVRTAWLPDRPGGRAAIVLALERRIIRLGKLRMWLQSPPFDPATSHWPYNLATTERDSDTVISAPLHSNQDFDVRLLAPPAALVASNVVSRYLYLFGFDCAGNPYVLYPSRGLDGVAKIPEAGPNGSYPPSVTLARERVGTPLGADTLFLLATGEKTFDPEILTDDRVSSEDPTASLGEAGTRDPTGQNWFVQRIVVSSRP